LDNVYDAAHLIRIVLC